MRVIVGFLCLSLFSLGLMAKTLNEWEEVREADGIKVFKKDIEGSDIVAFRGRGVIEAPVEKILWVLLENKHRTDWVDRLKRNMPLETPSLFDYTVYQEFGLPWPISNRDFVYKGHAARKKSGVVTLDLQSTENDKAPKTVGVRAKIYHSGYTMTPLGPNKTHVQVEIHSDPKGWLPKWFVNILQKEWPLKTLKGIRAQVKKDFVRKSPLPPIGA